MSNNVQVQKTKFSKKVEIDFFGRRMDLHFLSGQQNEIQSSLLFMLSKPLIDILLFFVIIAPPSPNDPSVLVG